MVATDDRRLRIVTGSGLTDRLSDGTASEIIGGTITPLFRAGRMRDGVLAGLDEIRRQLGHDVTAGNQLADPNMAAIPAATDSDPDDSPGWVGFLVLPLVIGVFGFVGFMFVRDAKRNGWSWGGSHSSGSSSSSFSGSSGFGGGSSSGGGSSGSW